MSPSPTNASAAAASAADYARALLDACGAARAALPRSAALDPGLDAVREWARSGAMALTGNPGGPPALAPGPLALAARGAALALAALAPESPALAALDGPALLGERAALAGLARRGQIAPGGGCRLLATRDGWLALNLARPEDRELLPAWLEARAEPGEDAWAFARRVVRERPRLPAVERGRLMGLPLAAWVPPPAIAEPWLHAEPARAAPSPPPPSATPRVVDLSSLWAGPLCGHLLAAAGARVIKVESRGRPDGARQAAGPFFDLLNAGKASIALDLAENAGRQRLRGLIAEADIVVESARPRALAQLGIDAAACTAARPGQIWLSITGHGRRGPAGHWVGFGDDAAIAAGAAARLGPGPIFCGDAIADPLTGLHAAVAALAHFRAGRGALLDVSLHAVTRYALAAGPAGPGTPAGRARIEATGRGASAWRVVTAQGEETVAPPRARPAPGRAAPLGADNAGLLGENHGFTALEAAR